MVWRKPAYEKGDRLKVPEQCYHWPLYQDAENAGKMKSLASGATNLSLGPRESLPFSYRVKFESLNLVVLVMYKTA